MHLVGLVTLAFGRPLQVLLHVAEPLDALLHRRVTRKELGRPTTLDCVDDKERVCVLYLPEVLLGDSVHVVADLRQRGGKVHRRTGKHRAGSVRRILPVPR